MPIAENTKIKYIKSKGIYTVSKSIVLILFMVIYLVKIGKGIPGNGEVNFQTIPKIIWMK